MELSHKKDRILLVSKFYYRRGGACVYVLNLERVLKEKGHEVAVFAMDYPENIDSRWSEYFAPEVSFTGDTSEKMKMMRRLMGRDDLSERFERILLDFKPDVVHLNNIHSYLSPVVADVAAKHGVKVVWTLHDFKLLCPAYLCMRDGRPCTECFGNKLNVIRHRCMKKSFAGSVAACLEALKWSRKHVQKSVDTFITPSRFLGEKMKAGRFSPDKIKVVNNFIPSDMIPVPESIIENRRDYYCYVGRLSEEKGLRKLLKVAATLDREIRIAGDGPLAEELKARYKGYDHIKFLGRLSADEVRKLLSEARFSIIPSECYENNPLSVMESLCVGTPVAGAEIGGIPELIDDESGITFKSGDEADMTQVINAAWWGPWDYRRIAEIARERFNEDRHYKELTDIYRR